MIHHGVLPRKVRRKARLSRADRRPYFGADGGAHAVGESVVKQSGKGRLESHTHSGSAVAVLIPREVDVFRPLGGDALRSQADSLLLHRVQVDQLQVEVIIRQCAVRVEPGVPIQVHDLLTALHRCPQRTADVFAQPAGIYPVIQSLAFHMFFPSLCPHIHVMRKMNTSAPLLFPTCAVRAPCRSRRRHRPTQPSS